LKYVIDRFEENFAVLESEDGKTIDVKKELLKGFNVGDVLLLKDGTYELLKEETEERKKRIDEKMKKLFGK